jgi:hypothetical protein
MKLIEDIINELVDTSVSITSPLLKTKVLANRLGNHNLSTWVNRELTGYTGEDSLPEYRIFSCQFVGSYIAGNMKHDNHPIPTNGLDKEIQEGLRNLYLRQSISSLEKHILNQKNGYLEHEMSAEMVALVQINWQKMGNPFLRLLNCRKAVSITAVDEIISSVRNKLLDFSLKIDEEFGNISEIESLKEKTKEITRIMNQTIINTNGDGNFVNTGNDSHIETKITINKYDQQSLKKYLKQIGIVDNDVEDLCEIIDTEKPDEQSMTFGSKVNNWIQKMIGKSLDGSWQVGIGAAGNLLADIIQQYYGLK